MIDEFLTQQPGERCPGCTVCAEPCSESNHYNLPWSKPTENEIKLFNEKQAKYLQKRRPRKKKAHPLPIPEPRNPNAGD